MAPRAASAVSTNRQKAAPRDRASKPSAPEPANRSITRRSRTPGDQGACSRMLNTAWRARSEVGRVSGPGGVARVLPRNSPETMRKAALLVTCAFPFQAFARQSKGGRHGPGHGGAARRDGGDDLRQPAVRDDDGGGVAGDAGGVPAAQRRSG